jgi:predicted transcriptional regulator
MKGNTHSRNLHQKINMQQLTNAEEQVMEHLWKLEKAFMKDLLEAYQNKTCNHNHRYFIKRMIDKQL